MNLGISMGLGLYEVGVTGGREGQGHFWGAFWWYQGSSELLAGDRRMMIRRQVIRGYAGLSWQCDQRSKLEKEIASKAEHEAFIDLVRAGGEVSQFTLRMNVPVARCLAFLRKAEVLMGVGALKRPLSDYRTSLHKKASIAVDAADFPFELGYVFVAPEARGRGYSRELVNAALQAAGTDGIFATARCDNAAMQATLARFGFAAAGRDYAGRTASQRIQLFLRCRCQI